MPRGVTPWKPNDIYKFKILEKKLYYIHFLIIKKKILQTTAWYMKKYLKKYINIK